jgi:hypothetical protein
MQNNNWSGAIFDYHYGRCRKKNQRSGSKGFSRTIEYWAKQVEKQKKQNEYLESKEK